jgi:hypothetical protein
VLVLDYTCALLASKLLLELDSSLLMHLLLSLLVHFVHTFVPSIILPAINLIINLGGCDSQYKDEVCTITKEDRDNSVPLTFS